MATSGCRTPIDRGRRRTITAACLLVAIAVGTIASAEETVRLDAATRSLGDLTMTFPAVTYRPPIVGSNPTKDYAAAISDALGIRIDPVRDHLIDAQNRALFRHPDRPGVLLKIYKTPGKSPRVIAKLLQRDLAIADLLRRLGVRHARIADVPALQERGGMQQERVEGESLDRLHPSGYRSGTTASVDRLLAALRPHDDAVRTLVARQLGLTARNDVDCKTVRSLGFDLGHCYANVFVESGSGDALLVDW